MNKGIDMRTTNKNPDVITNVDFVKWHIDVQ